MDSWIEKIVNSDAAKTNPEAAIELIKKAGGPEFVLHHGTLVPVQSGPPVNE